MRESRGDMMERIVFLVSISILCSVLGWQIVDKLIVSVNYFQSLLIELTFVILLKLYIFISRKVESAYRD
jgi:hypothetical protein